MNSNVSGAACSRLSTVRACALRLDGAHRRLHRGVVPRRGDRPRRGPDAVLPHGAAEPQRRVPRPVVRVACAAGGRPPAGDRRLERVVGRPGVHAVGHRPADGPPGPYVHHERRAGPPAAGAHVGDVGEPGLVGAVGGEVAPHQVGGGPGLRRGCLRSPLRPPRAAARGAGPAVVAHEARHALARRAHPAAQQLHVHLRGAVDAPARLAGLRDQPRGPGVPEIAGARPPAPPRAVALPGRPERRAHVRDPPGALVGRYGREPGPLRGRAYS